ncbi:MAG: hypothetical protein K1Y02_00080 [Candidatus Hydrogenedentes bacterium]|nr:hypothetical protein [Candidatus Hydrogenedentota bacterium]
MACFIALAALFAQVEEPIVYFDLAACVASLPDDSVLRYDTVKFVAALQGLVNRERPRLIVRFFDGSSPTGPINVDDYWFEKMRAEWLKGRTVERTSKLDDLIARYSEARNGVVVWDQTVPATANVAATVCGVEGWLPVRAGGALYAQLVNAGPKLPVKLSLAGKFTGAESGSAKCDAYLWAMHTYIETGRCNNALMAYYLDGYTHRPDLPGIQYNDLSNGGIANQDYYIARKAFVFDLGPWADEAPVDDPKQPLGTDRATLCAILKAQVLQNDGKSFTTVGGFVPWNLKYTDAALSGGKHGAVPTEWEYAAILSAHNAVMDADALGLVGLANASAYMHYPLAKHYTQNPKPKLPPLEDKTYVLVYMGDYDSAAWLSRQIPAAWDDPARGQMPIAWAFNPNLADRVPYVFDTIMRTKSANDWFIGGDSGAGYLNPNLLTGDRLGSGVPDALDLWVTHNKAWYERFDYSITGFVINGFHGDMPLRVQEAYAKFSPDGVGMQLGFEKPIVNGTPFIRHVSDIYPDPKHLEVAAQQMAGFAKPERPQFLIFRMILQTPSTIVGIRDRLLKDYPEHQWEFPDPYTFFALAKETLAK